MKRFLSPGAVFLLAACLLPQSATSEEPSILSVSIQPAGTLNLSECISRALRVAPALLSARYDRESVEWKLREAKSAYFLPEVKLRVLGGIVPGIPDGSGPEGNFPDVDTQWGDLGPFIQARVEGIQPLYTFGKLSNLKRAAERGVHAKEAQEAVVAAEVTRQVKKVYYGIIFLRSLEDFLNELNERATSAKDRLTELIAKHNPEVTEIDLMRLDVFFAETRRNLIEARNGIDLGMATLGILTGGLGAAPVSPEEKMLIFKEIQLGSLDYYLSRAAVSRPELKQLDDLIRIKEALMKATGADFFPAFFLGGYYSYGKAPGREHVENPFLKDDFNYNSGGGAVGMEQKLSFHMTTSRYNQSAADYRKATADRQQALMGIQLEIRKAYSDAFTKTESVKAAREGFRVGRSWVTATTLNFSVNLLPVKDLLEAFVVYSKMKVGFLNTIQDFNMALTDLSRAIGEEISDVRR